jgi:hypothetical protein
MSTIRDIKSSEPSLCIPRVFSNITEERVWEVLDELELGEIDRIDMVEKEARDGDLYQRVFIHFKSWNGPQTQGGMVRKRVLDGEQVKIVYDDPWFWKVSASRSKRPRASTERRPPRIEFVEKTPFFHKKEVKKVDDSKRSESVSYAAAAAAAGKCGDAIMAAQHEEEDELNAGLSVDAASKIEEKMSSLRPTSPLKRSWGSS